MKKSLPFQRIPKVCMALVALACLPLLARADVASLAKVECVTLEGKPVPAGNPVEGDRIKTFSAPALLLFRSEVKPAKGTVLLFPGGGYRILEMQKEGENTARFLNQKGFDVALLEYHVASGPQTRDLALGDALAAFRLLKTKAAALGLQGNRLGLMGYSAGGHLAARTAQNLAANEQPDDLILVYPAYLDEAIPGTVISAVKPPLNPGRLFVAISANDNADWVKSTGEYTKTWKGYGGTATFHLLPASGHGFGMEATAASSAQRWPDLLADYLQAKPAEVSTAANPAAAPTAGRNASRHHGKVAAAQKEKFDLILVGDSITNNFEKAAYQQVWNQFFAPRHALNLGYSGYRTENIVWNLQNGELDGQSPKAITLMIGTNNVDEKNYPTRHTASQLAGGIEAIVKVMRKKCPAAKILIVRSFPGCYGGPNPTSHRAILDRAWATALKLADGQHVFFCDVNHVFLNLDGSIKKELMPDWLHPNPEGARLWARAMEPFLSELMGTPSLDTEKPANTAIVPVPKLEQDNYGWEARHAGILKIKDSTNPEIIFIGDSITHHWGGLPPDRLKNGESVLKSVLGQYRVLNLGFGWDRTQNVLWRLDHGELDGLHPRAVVINIGTNNTSETKNARQNTPAEIVEGVKEICARIRSKTPQAKIILMAVFPREKSPNHPRRKQINEINPLLAEFAKTAQITFVDIGAKMLAPDGTVPREIAGDYCHPTEKGYQIWADAILPLIAAP